MGSTKGARPSKPDAPLKLSPPPVEGLSRPSTLHGVSPGLTPGHADSEESSRSHMASPQTDTPPRQSPPAEGLSHSHAVSPSDSNEGSQLHIASSQSAEPVSTGANMQPALPQSCDKQREELSAVEQVPPASEQSSVADASPAEELSSEQVEEKLAAVAHVKKQLDELHLRIESFSDLKGSKERVFLEESLMSLMLQLDAIEAAGSAQVRAARRTTVKAIQGLLDRLETKA